MFYWLLHKTPERNAVLVSAISESTWMAGAGDCNRIKPGIARTHIVRSTSRPMTGEGVPINPDIPSLGKVTLSYVFLEDRVQLSGLDTQGQTIRLWSQHDC